jgi:N-acetylglutamate synthase-like GNAT family acetyltransferase
MSNSLPPEICIRPAACEDDRAIRALVRSQHLNPLGLDWRNFLVAADSAGEIVSIGAVKKHGDGSWELASIATVPERRRRGLAGAVIRAILARRSQAEKQEPLYLMCRNSRKQFYEQFGFREIAVEEMPPYFRRLFRLFSIATRLVGIENRLTVMRNRQASFSPAAKSPLEARK